MAGLDTNANAIGGFIRRLANEEYARDFDQDAEEFKTRLQECLDDVQPEGNFSSFQTHSTYINPGLRVKDIGNVGLPLSECDAKAIASVSKQVRKLWELDITEFKCRNPA
jgi:hypothetical protein